MEHPHAIEDELRSWFDEWGGYVQSRDFDSARALFHPDVAGFGTHMRIVHGLSHLERDQWRNVWPTISDFQFRTDAMEAGASNDGLLAWAIVPWTSTGYREDAAPFERPGRATVIFTREHWNEPWRAIHTHFSLAPGTPQRSFGFAR